MLGDLHCGHKLGLTPPDWWSKWTPNEVKQAWDEYKNAALQGPFDFVVVNGDAIDGKGTRSGGTEHITVDRFEQGDMAVAAIRAVVPEGVPIYMTYGTPYHVGMEEDMENIVAQELGAHIENRLEMKVEQVLFDIRHFISSSSVPYGRGTALLKELVWNVLNADACMANRADVVVRSHVHYSLRVQDGKQQAITLPALQLKGSKFGAKKCSGKVHFGWSTVEVDGSNARFFTNLVEYVNKGSDNVYVI